HPDVTHGGSVSALLFKSAKVGNDYDSKFAASPPTPGNNSRPSSHTCFCHDETNIALHRVGTDVQTLSDFFARQTFKQKPYNVPLSRGKIEFFKQSPQLFISAGNSLKDNRAMCSLCTCPWMFH